MMEDKDKERLAKLERDYPCITRSTELVNENETPPATI
jgi:hypothetical protein